MGPTPGGLQGQGSRRPLHEWPTVKSASGYGVSKMVPFFWATLYLNRTFSISLRACIIHEWYNIGIVFSRFRICFSIISPLIRRYIQPCQTTSFQSLTVYIGKCCSARINLVALFELFLLLQRHLSCKVPIY